MFFLTTDISEMNIVSTLKINKCSNSFVQHISNNNINKYKICDC